MTDHYVTAIHTTTAGVLIGCRCGELFHHITDYHQHRQPQS